MATDTLHGIISYTVVDIYDQLFVNHWNFTDTKKGFLSVEFSLIKLPKQSCTFEKVEAVCAFHIEINGTLNA